MDRTSDSNPLLEALARQVRDGADREALWSRGEQLRLTFGQLAERIRDRRRQLAGLWRDGSPVALSTGNCAAFVDLYVALRHLGATVVAMDGSLPLAASLRTCRELGIGHLLVRDDTSAAAVDMDAAAARDSQTPLGEGVRWIDVALDAEGRSVAAELPAGTGLVKLTSGSTGRPTGACFGDGQLLAGIRQIAEAMDLEAWQRVLMCIPLSHSYGFDNGVLSLMAVGTPLVLQPSIFPVDLLRALAESQAHFLPLVPPLVRSLGQTPWPENLELELERVICAGGALLPEAARTFHEASGLRVHNFYGSTETGGICFERAPHEADAAGTVGTPLPGVTVEIDDVRRVVVRSAANLTGRWTAAGHAVLGTERQPAAVRTGDTAEWTDGGRLRLTGRTADILNIGGRKIAAAEVEAALRGVDGVEQAAVVGVDDAARGDRIVAFLVTDRWPVDLSALPHRLTPREVRRVDGLPHTERGKLDRQSLRDLAGEPSR